MEQNIFQAAKGPAGLREPATEAKDQNPPTTHKSDSESEAVHMKQDVM